MAFKQAAAYMGRLFHHHLRPTFHELFSLAGRCQAQSFHATSPGGDDTVSAVFEHDAVLRFGPSKARGFQENFRIRFPLGYVLGSYSSRKES